MDEVIKIGEKLLSLVVCTTINDREELTREVNLLFTCGTTLGWVISDRDEVMQCDTYPDRKHWLFDC